MTTSVLAPHEIIQIDPKTLKSSAKIFKLQLSDKNGFQIGWIGLHKSNSSWYAVIVQQESDAVSFQIYTDSDGNTYLEMDGNYLNYTTSAKWAYFSAWGGATAWTFESDGSLYNTSHKQHLSYYDSSHPQLYVYDDYNWAYVKMV